MGEKFCKRNRKRLRFLIESSALCRMFAANFVM